MITPLWASGKTALSSSLESECPLHGTLWVTWPLTVSGQAQSLPSSLPGISVFPGRALVPLECSAGAPWAITALPLSLTAANARRVLSLSRAVCVIRAGDIIHTNSLEGAGCWLQPRGWAAGRLCLSHQPREGSPGHVHSSMQVMQFHELTWKALPIGSGFCRWGVHQAEKAPAYSFQELGLKKWHSHMGWWLQSKEMTHTRRGHNGMP